MYVYMIYVTPIVMPARRTKIQQMNKAKQRCDLQQHHRLLHTYIKGLSENGTTSIFSSYLEHGMKNKAQYISLFFSTCHSPRCYRQNKLLRDQRQKNYWLSISQDRRFDNEIYIVIQRERTIIVQVVLYC